MFKIGQDGRENWVAQRLSSDREIPHQSCVHMLEIIEMLRQIMCAVSSKKLLILRVFNVNLKLTKFRSPG